MRRISFFALGVAWLVFAVVGDIYARRHSMQRAALTRQEGSVTEPRWEVLKIISVPAKPEGVWTVAMEYVEGPRKLRLRVVPDEHKKMEWHHDAAAKACGPDGDLSAAIPGDALSAQSLLGALIAKVGGGAGEKPTDGKTVYSVGRYAVISLDATGKGALFVAMNDSINKIANHTGELKLEISEAP